jgi:hypothetical protein
VTGAKKTMLYRLKRNFLRTSFSGQIGREKISVGSGLFSYWKLAYQDLRCNRYFLRRKISNNFNASIRLTIKRKLAYINPYQFVWTSDRDTLIATNVSSTGQARYDLAGSASRGTIYASENEIVLGMDGQYSENLVLPILGEFVFWTPDAGDGNST